MADCGKVTAVPKILVIEDEPDQNKLIKLRLEARGFRVFSVGKAKEGIELAVREKVDLILMDMILPDLHGLDATINLKRNPETKDIPVIGLSAVGSPDFMKACLQEGVAAYVKKPYDPRELFKIIEKFVKVKEEVKPGRGRPAAAARKGFQDKLRELENQFKRKQPSPPPEKVSPHGQKVEDMLKGALADFPLASAKKPGPAAPRPRAEAKTILIVDDDTVFGQAISVCLTRNGYEVLIALDGVSGLKQAFQKRPDLILLNLTLPAGGGETVLLNLRKAPETGRLPVFIMSSLLSAKKLEEKARELGAQGFIAKPIDPEDLLYIIESVVGAS
ncbi:MAG: response regulator [Acidobacteriota bacterium]